MREAQALASHARNVEKSHDFAEAATLFRQAYELEPSCFCATRLLHCMRRQGVEAARQAARWARDRGPGYLDDLWFRREYVWSIYDGYLKRVSDDPSADTDYGDAAEYKLMQQAAARILQLTDEEMPRRLAVFAACRAAKARGQYGDVLQLAGQLDGESLSTQAQTVQGRQVPSDHERWLNLLARASYETQQYEVSLAYCEQGCTRYPRSLSFAHRKALVLLATEQPEPGLALLLDINRRYGPQWFIRADIGRCYARTHKLAQARLWLCEAALLPGDLEGRITVFGELAEVLEQQVQYREAAAHRRLAWALAAVNGWERRAARELSELVRLRQLADAADTSRASQPQEQQPPKVREAVGPCRELWLATVRQAHPECVGVIKMYNAERGFGFIAETQPAQPGQGSASGSVELHFRAQAYRGPAALLKPGTRVTFVKQPSFDAKKGVESTCAVQVRPADG
jgi:tetratricopeptide (TPR) repeat protein/cold shock CspA family protein